MLALVAALAAAAFAAPGPFTIDPPPGWTQIRDASAPPQVLLQLHGPETSSFVMTAAPRLPMSNRAAVRAYLVQVADSVSRASGEDFGPPGPLLTARYDNGLTLLYVECQRPGHDKLVLGAADFGGRLALGTLVSNVPDTLMPSIFGALRAPDSTDPGAPSVSLDGQLQLALGPGLRTRPLTAAERKQGFVLAVEGLASEVMVLKVSEDDAVPAKDEPQLVRQTVLAFPGVEANTVGPVSVLETLPGPDFIYAAARVHDPAGPERFMAGYMPWGYWGYSVLAKGSQPVELARAVFGSLALGPSAEPKVVASTPPIPVSRPFRWRSRAGAAVAAILLALTAAALLALRRRPA